MPARATIQVYSQVIVKVETEIRNKLTVFD